jgi:site-specific DNA-methyltransferase (adenine-specific)
MGKDWDSTGIAYDIEMWEDVYRVLKPGGHIVVFAHTTTYDIVATAMRLAGFKMREMLLWHYGSGFSKGLNISMAILNRLLDEWLEEHPQELKYLNDLDSKDERKNYRTRLMVEIGIASLVNKEDIPKRNQRRLHTDFRSNKFHRSDGTHEQLKYTHITAEHPLAKMWDGWHTLLKPSTEPAILAMKPLEEGLNFEQNVIKWRTGALNIDACRIPVNPVVDDILKKTRRRVRASSTWKDGSGFTNEQNEHAGVQPNGRFATNLVLSHHENCVLVRPGTKQDPVRKVKSRQERFSEIPTCYSFDKRGTTEVQYAVSDEVWACVPGCPIRIMNDQAGFRYASGSITGDEPSEKTRSRKLYKEMPRRFPFKAYTDNGGPARFFYCAKASVKERNLGLPEGFRNEHVSIKPINLLSYYIRLVTPTGGTVLDQFAGVGSSMIAAYLEDMNFVGCEINPRWVRIAELRFEEWKKLKGDN